MVSVKIDFVSIIFVRVKYKIKPAQLTQTVQMDCFARAQNKEKNGPLNLLVFPTSRQIAFAKRTFNAI